MAYKVFQNGFPLNASELNNYLMNQSVMVFATATARDTDLTAPLEGMIVWLQDSNKFVYYNGSGAWTDVNVTGNGANAIINGAFDIWQRGTSVANTASYTQYVTDRWQFNRAGLATGATISRQAGTTDIRYAARVQRDSGNTSTGAMYFMHTLETADSLKFAGQAVTVSFYARAGANYSATSNALGVRLDTGTGTDQSLGGALTGQTSIVSQTATLTTSWQRFSYTATVGSSATQVGFYVFATPTGTAGAADYFEITGVQLESGSTATAFKRNSSNIQGELAACQRYFQRFSANSSNLYAGFGSGHANSSTTISIFVPLRTTMRSTPTFATSGSFQALSGGSTSTTTPTLAADQNGTDSIVLNCTVSGFTAGQGTFLRALNDATANLSMNAEL